MNVFVTTLDLFQSTGTHPVCNDKLKRAATEVEMVFVVSFSMRADIPSGPVALVTSSEHCTCSILHNISHLH